MNQPKISEIRRIVGAVKRSSQKVITLERLSHLVGLYPMSYPTPSFISIR
jgi:hypothetical protein